MGGGFPVTRKGYSPNERCRGQGCVRMVGPGVKYRLMEKDADTGKIEVTEPLCHPCALAMREVSRDDTAQMMLLEEK